MSLDAAYTAIAMPPACIHIKGAREHNLQNLELRLPRQKLVVFTGVSGSGKSSLAFDTIYAEGYRKYMESLSVRARQLLDQLKRPEVEFITGLPPVIAIEQRTGAGANPRSTVATVTEIADFARLAWTMAGEQRCPLDGGAIERRTLDDCITRIFQEPAGSKIVLLASGETAKPAFWREEIPRLRQRGFTRARINGELRELHESDLLENRAREITLELVVDRLVVDSAQRSRLADSLELAFREGHDRAIALAQSPAGGAWREIPLSQRLACAICGTVYEPLTPRHFSYNHPEGACAECGGLGRTLQFAPELVVPAPDKTVRNGAIKPWRFGSKAMIIKRNAILRQLAAQLPFDPEVPWHDLPEEARQAILHGAGERLFSFKLHSGNHKPETLPFAGVLADLEETRRNTSSDGLRARLLAFQVSSPCLACQGRRLNPRSRAVRVAGKGFDEFMAMTVDGAGSFATQIRAEATGLAAAVDEAWRGLEHRLHFLGEVGLGYLTLEREYGTLSGGEAQRARLATQLGTGLVGVAYVLDEPSIGLHPRDNRALVRLLLGLRDRGNAVLVVEHDADMILAADHLVELGPGAGVQGGIILFEGTPDECMQAPASHTGAYLSGRAKLEKSVPSRAPDGRWLTVRGAAEHNLQNVDAAFPLQAFTVVCGVSGSGKSTLVNEILGHAAAWKLNGAKTIPGRYRALEGLENFQSVVRVDQEPIGRSPRSNPATFTKLFDLLRDLFAQCALAKVRGYKANRFSFNVRGGRCERCQGDGVIRLDMQFLEEVHVECPGCQGRRYNRETLEVRFKGINIADALDLTVAEALAFFRAQPRLVEKLRTLDAVGLGYLKLGQPATTLSGGEAQRLKLSLELSKRQQGGTLYLLDEPTTGLHWVDIQRLLDLLFQLREAGNTIVVIEHHLDVIRQADWVLELGPGGGSTGGRLVYAGPPAGLARADTPTGICLKRPEPRPGRPAGP
ncbi:MAG TPA: excinuclease ABC subunit UvrA [Opitutales bacterium]|jgi:excinuclease ABC subunit A|nr:excinuclease ABC subunit UvrA [Opitutales bacterium]